MFAAKSAAPYADQRALRKPAIDKVTENQITVFTSPAGFLYTDSLAAALSEKGFLPVWLRLGSEDCDPGTLLVSLISSAQRICPEIGIATLNRMQGYPGTVNGWHPLYTYLCQEFIESLPKNCAIVLEQVHILNIKPSTLSLLSARLLADLSTHFPVILISDQRLPNAILPSRIETKGILDLRLDNHAGLALLESNQPDFSADCLRRAIGLVEGRIGALVGLFSAVGMLGPAYVQYAVDRSKNAEQLFTLISRAWLGTAEASNIQALALGMHLEYIHPALLEAVLGRKGKIPAEPWLQPLVDEWKRVRRIWRLPLERTLQVEIDKNFTGIHRAADYLSLHGAPDKAIQIYFSLEDYPSAARVINAVAEEYLNLGRWETLAGWLNQLSTDSLLNWPWLVYVKGELAAASGDTRNASWFFSESGRIFLERHEMAGVCQSLLAESSVAICDQDYDRAQSHAQLADTFSKDPGMEPLNGWANWLLGRLATYSENLDRGIFYFSQASEKIKNPFLSGLFLEVETLAQNQLELRLQREFHYQEYLRAENEERNVSDRLRSFIDTPPQNLPALLSTHGWSETPLMLKMPISPHLVKDDPPKVAIRILQPLIQVLGQLRQLSTRASGLSKKNPPVAGFPIPFPTEVDSWIISPPQEQERTNQTGPTKELSRMPTGGLSLARTEKPSGSSLKVYVLGPFRAFQADQLVENWSSRKALAVFKFLLANRQSTLPKEVLMDTFWPDSDTESARRNLHQAIYALRQTLRKKDLDFQYIQFENDSYRLNPGLQIWLDHEEFEQHYLAGQQLEKRGKLEPAVLEYSAAEELYQDHYMADDVYESWPQARRQYLWEAYLSLANHLAELNLSKKDYTEAISICQRVLTRDKAQEDAHRTLMQCYIEQGQRHMALHQYQLCVQAMMKELGLSPSPETRRLYKQLMDG